MTPNKYNNHIDEIAKSIVLKAVQSGEEEFERMIESKISTIVDVLDVIYPIKKNYTNLYNAVMNIQTTHVCTFSEGEFKIIYYNNVPDEDTIE